MTIALIVAFLTIAAAIVLHDWAIEESRRLDDLIYLVMSTPLEDDE
jgi:CRISPR/Cas system-associated endonuclease Cas3-HD